MTHVAFGDRLVAEFAAGRYLCAGIDPHGPLLAGWRVADDAAGAERMGRDVVAAAAGVAACVKPQIAFFERFGSAGFAALERVFADAREAGLLVVADVKRGDIGSSFAAYADAWLSPGSPLEADAMTVVAYQGFDTLSGALHHVEHSGKGLFVLAATSNPEAIEVQQARRADGRTVAAAMVEDAAAWNAAHAGSGGAGGAAKIGPAGAVGPVGSVGVVLGATLDLSAFEIDTAERPAGPALPVLAPGFGHQGARLEDASSIFGGIGHALLANESRSILTGGPTGLADRIRERAEAAHFALGVKAA